jgi:hypothetical protein
MNRHETHHDFTGLRRGVRPADLIKMKQAVTLPVPNNIHLIRESDLLDELGFWVI